MKTEELKIKYPVGLEHAVHMTKDEMEQHIRLMAALKMFEHLERYHRVRLPSLQECHVFNSLRPAADTA